MTPVFQTFLFNTVTRVIGAIIRVCAISAGLLLQLILVVGFLGYIACWMVAPLLVAFLVTMSIVRPF